jgi:hypothetical protein
MDVRREALRDWVRRWRAVEDDRVARLAALDEHEARTRTLDLLDHGVPPARDEESTLVGVQAVFAAWRARVRP